MLNIIRGRAGSGKTEFLFNLIEAHLNCGDEKPLFLVPEQFSFVTERELLVRFGAKRAKNVEVTSFSRLARTEFQKIPSNKRSIQSSKLDSCYVYCFSKCSCANFNYL